MSFELSDNFNDNTIDVRDIIERVEDLRGERDSAAMEHVDACEEAGTEGTWDEGEAKWAEDNPDDAPGGLLVRPERLRRRRAVGG